MWVVAACEGMISLFEKTPAGALALRAEGGGPVFSSLEEFQRSMDRAEQVHAFDRLIIVGSGSDIAWVHSTLPEAMARHIAAEIKYPLLPAWFRQAAPLSGLTHALESVFTTH